MESKQVNISIPKRLYEETTNYAKEFGYKNIQEVILESLRNKVIFDTENSEENLELNPEYIKKILSLDMKKDFLNEKDSKNILDELKKRAKLK